MNYHCAECAQAITGGDIEDRHTRADGEDVHADCCPTCNHHTGDQPVSYFTVKTRTDGTQYTTFADDAPQWVQKAVQQAHDDELPNDWRFVVSALLFDEHDIDNDSFSVTDWLLDNVLVPSNVDLVKWLSDYISRSTYIDDYLAGASNNLATSNDFFDVLRGAQSEAIRRMADVIFDYIEGNR